MARLTSIDSGKSSLNASHLVTKEIILNLFLKLQNRNESLIRLNDIYTQFTVQSILKEIVCLVAM